jgi:penicillin-binding protein 2
MVGRGQELQKFGFGAFTGIDIQGEVRGLLPSTEWKRKAYKRPEQQKWYAGETISLGIGQGYNNFTMLQLALATGVIANDGIKMKPHLVKEVVDVVTRTSRETLREIKAEAIADPKNIAVIRNALVGVNTEGTGATAFRGAGYVAAGKTGTAQVVAIKQYEKSNAARMAERLRVHALYMAFAPADKPKIALAMVVENAGFGGAMAAPIARRVFDYWLLGQSPTPEDMAAVQKGQAGPPPGAPRPPASAASAPRAPPRQRLPWQPPPRRTRPGQPRDVRCPKAPEPPMRCGSEASARRGMISAPFIPELRPWP